MRIKILAVTIAAASVFAPMANASDGTINFTGSILDTACVVDTGSSTQTIPLGSVSKSSFVNKGDVSGIGNFTISLTGCDASITRASVRFDGLRSTDDNRLLALTPGTGADTPAVGVGIAIYESDNINIIPMGTKSAGIPISPPAGGDLVFMAKYMATTDASGITAGNGGGSATFTLDYN